MKTISTLFFLNSRQPKPEQNSLMSWLLKILLWRPAFNFWRRAKPMIWHYLSDKKWTKGHLQRKLKSWKISSKRPKLENNDLLRLSRKRHQISEKYLIDLLVIFPIKLLFTYLPILTWSYDQFAMVIKNGPFKPYLSKDGLISDSFY